MISSLTPIERRLTRTRLLIDPALVEGHPCRAMIVGEAPGPRTSARCPMFPLPEYSAGGRLQKLSGLSHVEYLQRFVRRDLLDYCPPGGRWRAVDLTAARAAAALILPEVEGRTLVMLGRNVAKAFGHDDMAPFTVVDYHDTTWGRRMVVRLPHPSGRVTAYADPEARAKARALLRAAAAVEMPPCPACATTVLCEDPPAEFTCACGVKLLISYSLEGPLVANVAA